ncbi:hypothetical protein OTK49_21525 [Vibrio coralliirubri]|uniref:hypothetical protein n=1 Tax=Vibrio coralliirubri TaxID=1516159 RepID=UPI0022833294|nr:hypothetical protein [Vibrio coralliirubri]MCY9865103.1 hypothetical protein [Vibrio coralliirubri]
MELKDLTDSSEVIDFRIQPIEPINSKLVRLMTLEEYTETITPVVKEIRAILRKKQIVTPQYEPLEFYTPKQFLAMHHQKALATIAKYEVTDQEKIDSLVEDYRYRASQTLWSQRVNQDAQPDEATLERFKELSGILLAAYEGNTHYFEFAKAQKSNVAVVRHAMDSKYVLDLVNGTLTFEELEAIAESVKVRVPKRIYEYKVASFKTERNAMSKPSKLFFDAMDAALEPHKQKLYSKQKDVIDSVLGKYPVQNGSEFPRACIGKVSPNVVRIISCFCNNDYETALEKCYSEYYNNLVLTFVCRIQSKLNLVNTNHETESITFTDTTFTNGIIETKSTIKYKGGLEIYNESSLIYAEGEIQTAHVRYITNFWINGKKQNQSELDEL